MQELRDMNDESLISPEQYEEAKQQHKQIFGDMAMLDISCFVFVDTSKKEEIFCFPNEIDANKFATEKANDMLNDYNGDVEIDAIVFEDIESYISYLENNQCD